MNDIKCNVYNIISDTFSSKTISTNDASRISEINTIYSATELMFLKSKNFALESLDLEMIPLESITDAPKLTYKKAIINTSIEAFSLSD
jgi:hypothetical protein